MHDKTLEEMLNENKPIPKTLSIADLPPERIEIMKNYAKELRRKFPHMKPARIEIKVAEYFKIKMV